MIIIGIGSNLISDRYRSRREACEASIKLLEKHNIQIIRQSSWYESLPIPPSSQSNFINGVIIVKTELNSFNLLKLLMKIEQKMGRRRAERFAARIIDLDLIAFDDQIIRSKNLTLPHPRLTQRAFVIKPIAEIAPEWRHPITGTQVVRMLETLSDQGISQLSD